MREDRLPVLVGVAQWVGRGETPLDPLDPLDVLTGLARDAAEDARAAAALLRAADSIGLVPVAGWSPANPVRLLAERVEARPAHEVLAGTGGEIAVRLVNAAAERIAAGKSQVALLAGLNPMATLRRMVARGEVLNWPSGGAGRPERIGDDRLGHDGREARHGLGAPIHAYPLIESALRARRGSRSRSTTRGSASCSRRSRASRRRIPTRGSRSSAARRSSSRRASATA